jgi:hypothetical protein
MFFLKIAGTAPAFKSITAGKGVYYPFGVRAQGKSSAQFSSRVQAILALNLHFAGPHRGCDLPRICWESRSFRGLKGIGSTLTDRHRDASDATGVQLDHDWLISSLALRSSRNTRLISSSTDVSLVGRSKVISPFCKKLTRSQTSKMCA